jgi:hypothetical protein
MTRVWNPVLEQHGLEEAGVLPPHDLGRRHRGEIGGPLMLAARAERLTEPEQDQRAGEQGGQDAEQEQRRLPALASQTDNRITRRHHGAGNSRQPRYCSTRVWNKSTTQTSRFTAPRADSLAVTARRRGPRSVGPRGYSPHEYKTLVGGGGRLPWLDDRGQVGGAATRSLRGRVGRPWIRSRGRRRDCLTGGGGR